METLIDKQLKNKEYDDLLRDLNLKIMRVTQEIRDHYPELNKFLKEIPLIIPDELNMEITVLNLKSYYDSLNMILNDYIREQA